MKQSIRYYMREIQKIFRRIKYRGKTDPEKFRCQMRDYNIGSDNMFPGPDRWDVRKNGDLCCSYCGAWHPRQFLAFCQEVIDNPDLRTSIEYLKNKGKFYVNRPLVRNAMEGAIKTRSVHIDTWLNRFPEDELKIYLDRLNKAIEVSRQKHKKHWDKIFTKEN